MLGDMKVERHNEYWSSVSTVRERGRRDVSVEVDVKVKKQSNWQSFNAAHLARFCSSRSHARV